VACCNVTEDASFLLNQDFLQCYILRLFKSEKLSSLSIESHCFIIHTLFLLLASLLKNLIYLLHEYIELLLLLGFSSLRLLGLCWLFNFCLCLCWLRLLFLLDLRGLLFFNRLSHNLMNLFLDCLSLANIIG
jgi:hypothetical protein